MPIDREELLDAFQREYRQLKGTTRDVRAEDHLIDDLAIDSLLGQELLAALEDEYGVELIGDHRLMAVRRVDELLDLVESVQATAPGRA